MSNELPPSTSVRKPLPPSPCVGVCVMEPDQTLCQGCGRSGEEIGLWSTADDDRKRQIWVALPSRLAGLGVRSFRLSQTPEAVGAFIAATFKARAGVWQLGDCGRVPEAGVGFSLIERDGIEPGGTQSDEVTGSLSVSVNEDACTAVRLTTEGLQSAIRLLRNDRVRVFGLGSELGHGRMEAVALVLPRGRARIGAHMKFTSLGRDEGAIRHEDRDGLVFDAGSGEDACRQLYRAKSAISEADIGSPEFVSKGGVKIIETALGRIETNGSDRECIGHDKATCVPITVQDAVRSIPSAFSVCAVFRPQDTEWLAMALPLGA